jgi:hypothetical protein
MKGVTKSENTTGEENVWKVILSTRHGLSKRDLMTIRLVEKKAYFASLQFVVFSPSLMERMRRELRDSPWSQSSLQTWQSLEYQIDGLCQAAQNNDELYAFIFRWIDDISDDIRSSKETHQLSLTRTRPSFRTALKKVGASAGCLVAAAGTIVVGLPVAVVTYPIMATLRVNCKDVGLYPLFVFGGAM